MHTLIIVSVSNYSPLEPDKNAGSFADIFGTLVRSVLCLHTSETFHNSVTFRHVEWKPTD